MAPHVPWGPAAAAALAVAAVYAAYVDAWMSAVPLGAGAVALLALLAERRPPRAVAGALGEAGGADELAAVLELPPGSMLVPEADGVHLFLGGAGRPVPRGPSPMVHREARSGVGVTLRSPAEGLMRLWASWNGLPRGQGIEEGLLHVRLALRRMALAHKVRVLTSGDQVVVHMRPRVPLGRGAGPTGPVPAFVASLLALGAARPVAITDVLVLERRVEVYLEVRPWTG